MYDVYTEDWMVLMQQIINPNYYNKPVDTFVSQALWEKSFFFLVLETKIASKFNKYWIEIELINVIIIYKPYTIISH